MARLFSTPIALIRGPNLKGVTADQLAQYIIRFYQLKNRANSNRMKLEIQKGPRGDRWDHLLSHQNQLSPKARRALARLLRGQPRTLYWKDIQALFRRSGFRAFQAEGGLELQDYYCLVSMGYYPVSWIHLPPKAGIGVDLIHDISHGLAMLDSDYRRGLVRFAQIYQKAKGSLATERVRRQFYRFFEVSYLAKSDGTTRSLSVIGATLDAVDPKERSPIRKDLNRLGKFNSKAEWKRKLSIELARMKRFET